MTCRYVGCNKIYTKKTQVRRVQIKLHPDLQTYAKKQLWIKI